MSQSLFNRLGGMEAITAAVDLFYEKLLSDALLAPFFADMDMEKLIQKQIAFMALAFNGPDEYKGRDLRSAHRQLVARHGLTDKHFDAVAGHLQATLRELDIGEDLISEVLAVVGTTRTEVLNR